MKKILISFMLTALTACTTPPAAQTSTPEMAEVKTQAEGKPTPEAKSKIKSCMCVKMYMPVCGEDKKTYGNSCEADCAGVKYTIGACKDKLQDV